MYNYKKVVRTINFNGMRFIQVDHVRRDGSSVVDVIRDYTPQEYAELQFMADKFNGYVSTYFD
ncbi:MAG: hypothetical protein Q4C49_00965 [Bacillota bacterium]|nr:hypothetical protein [Bacillota bacterium]